MMTPNNERGQFIPPNPLKKNLGYDDLMPSRDLRFTRNTFIGEALVGTAVAFFENKEVMDMFAHGSFGAGIIDLGLLAFGALMAVSGGTGWGATQHALNVKRHNER